MRILAAFAFLLLPLAGCALPRTAALRAMIHSEIPATQSAKSTNLNVSGLLLPFQNPGASIAYQCPMSARDTIAWYADALAKQGWILTHGSQSGWDPPVADASSPAGKYHATRIRWQLGGLILWREQLDAEFGFDHNNSPDVCFATFSLSEDSLFDKPAQGFERTFLPPFGKIRTDRDLMTLYAMASIYAIF